MTPVREWNDPDGASPEWTRERDDHDAEVSLFVRRAMNNDIPAQGYRGLREGTVRFDDAFDEDAPIGTQPGLGSRPTMIIDTLVTYERDQRVTWRR